ncbi:flagellar hook-basal body complex protein FliE [Marinobacterium nitratireducens]|uniref:Flagellar hook-basal body complex protein FliE n=1 Tax=Marinobacterium nitratireducens TaxID=518897 RepID=A0A917ZKS0_9GAMM|nr:flagellar hook-basal body complex protein FliE [Marinobacterium nitratireducens]GGO84974.1 flagellar hook-basal body complex protein FliE [Marinobacterium nitratireducens]
MVDRADINSVLMQMRAIQAQAQQGVAPVQLPGQESQMTAGAVDRTGFGELLKNAVDQVNELQTDAKKMATSYEQGDAMVDLPQVMVSIQKASVSFDAMTQVRNRLVSAYENIMQMPI